MSTYIVNCTKIKLLSRRCVLLVILLIVMPLCQTVPLHASEVFETPATPISDAIAKQRVRDTLTSGDLGPIDGGSLETSIGLRFDNVTIPKGAAVSSASIQFEHHKMLEELTSFALVHADSNRSSLSTASLEAILGLSVPNIPVVQTFPGSKHKAAPSHMADLATAFQDIFERGDWKSGNSIALFASLDEGYSEETGPFKTNHPATPLLHIEYNNFSALAATPQVNAGPDRSIALPADTVCLTGAANSGDAPAPLTFNWTQKSGPAGVVFTEPNALTTSAIFPGPGSYTLNLAATDGASAASDDVVVSVARVIHVPEDALTIQGAINLANNGDIVLVAPGVYVENPVLSKSITLASYYLTTHDASFIAQTVIDGNGGNAVLAIPGTAPPGITITGLTIRNGNNGIGAYKAFTLSHSRVVNTADGVDIENGGAGTVIRACTMENNTDDGIDFDKANAALIEDNIIRNNHDDGIEIRLQNYSGPPTLEFFIRRNKIYGNGEDGIQLIDHTGASARAFYIENNLIQGNIDAGLGLMSNGNTSENFEGASITDPIYLTNNTFSGNNHGVSGGDNMFARNNIIINSQVGLKNIDANSSVSHTVLWNNATHSLASNLGASIITADPLLDLNFFPLPGSPAIDAGTPTGMPFQGNAPDIGWVETPVNRPPAAIAGTDAAISFPNATVGLNGIASDDGLPNPPGVLTFNWSQVSGACGVIFDNANAPNTSATFPAVGVYDLKMTVHDGEQTDSDEIRITVSGSSGANIAPSVNAGADQAITLPSPASLNASVTDDGLPSGNLTYAWAKAEGPGQVTFGNAASLSTTAAFSEAGAYQLRLTASDGELSSSDVVVITVADATPVNEQPAVNAGADQLISFSANCGNPATPPPCAVLDGTVSDDGLPAPPGALSAAWSKISGPGAVTFADQTSPDTTVNFSTAGTYVLRLTANDSQLANSDDVQITVQAPPSPLSVYLSTVSGGTTSSATGGLSFADEDIIVYDKTTGTWSMYFDGSDVGLGGTEIDIDAFDIRPDGSILFSITTDGLSLPGIGAIDDSDIIRFIPASLGENTSGSFEWFFDGSDVELTSSSEDIDAIGFTPEGKLLVSTTGNPSVTGVSTPADEDLLVFTATTFGADTSGSWAAYFDGSDVGLNQSSSEDVNGAWIDDGNGDIFLTTLGDFSVTGASGVVSGDGGDIFKCIPASTGTTTSCANYEFIFDGLSSGLPPGVVLDGLDMALAASVAQGPVATILSPPDGATFSAGAAIAFSGTASDAEDGDLTPSLHWTSSLDGAIGDGGSFNSTSLSSGTHVITASITDSDGLQGIASRTVTVNAASTPNSLDIRVNASSDDAEQYVDGNSAGLVDLNSSDLEMVFEAATQTVGMRFNAVSIPPGATITQAYIQFTTDETGSAGATLQVWGQASDNAPTFTSAAGNISARPKTSASVVWNPPPWTTIGAAGPEQRTPDIAAVIQEIIDRPGWTSGNSLAVTVDGTGKRVAESYDGVPSAAPLLHVEYH